MGKRGFDRVAAAACRASVEEGARSRWRQYREIWAYVEGEDCRRRAILKHFGDHAEPLPAADGSPCCDVCDSGLKQQLPPPPAEEIAGLDDAILSVARGARPAVGRTTCAEILHGARTKKIERNSYDGLPAYATSSHMRRADILARVDQLIEEGRSRHQRRRLPGAEPGAGRRRGVSFNVGVLVSGEGTNLQAIIDSEHDRHGVSVVCVASSRREARGLERARAAGIATEVFSKADHADRDARDAALGNWLDDHAIDLLVLAGFMEVLGGPFIRRFEGKIINVHPSLLPAFPGIGSIQQALDYGVTVTGVTVHFVDEGVDSGPVILQEAFELPYARGHRGDRAQDPRDRAPAAASGGAADRSRRRDAGPRQPQARAHRWPRRLTHPPTARVTAPGEVRVRRALLTVSDKRGLVDFARGLAGSGHRARLHRRHGARARGGWDRDPLCRGLHRLSRDPRRPCQDAES